MVNYTFILIASLITLILLMANVPKVDETVKDTILSGQDKLKGQFSKDKNTSNCPDIYDPVCGGTVTYKNLCFATEANVGLVTQGECQP